MYLVIIKDSIIRSIILNASSKVEATSFLVSLFGEEYVLSNVVNIKQID